MFLSVIKRTIWHHTLWYISILSTLLFKWKEIIDLFSVCCWNINNAFFLSRKKIVIFSFHRATTDVYNIHTMCSTPCHCKSSLVVVSRIGRKSFCAGWRNTIFFKTHYIIFFFMGYLRGFAPWYYESKF